LTVVLRQQLGEGKKERKGKATTKNYKVKAVQGAHSSSNDDDSVSIRKSEKRGDLSCDLCGLGTLAKSQF
jgi:hypothetical protein